MEQNNLNAYRRSGHSEPLRPARPTQALTHRTGPDVGYNVWHINLNQRQRSADPEPAWSSGHARASAPSPPRGGKHKLLDVNLGPVRGAAGGNPEARIQFSETRGAR